MLCPSSKCTHCMYVLISSVFVVRIQNLYVIDIFLVCFIMYICTLVHSCMLNITHNKFIHSLSIYLLECSFIYNYVCMYKYLVPPCDRQLYDRQLHDRQFYDRQNHGKPTIHNTIFNFILF